MAQQEFYNLLLIGRTGNGKSSTGNTILGCDENKTRVVFRPRNANVSSDNDVIVQAQGKALGKNVLVIDGTGIGDTGSDATMDAKSLQKAIKDSVFTRAHKQSNAIEEAEEIELTAIILVLKFGVRFTKQEMDSAEDIRRRFGEDVFKKWGVIVMTYGDNFEKESQGAFPSWCMAQTGSFRSLLQECGYRCVMFNNKAQTIDTQQNQVEELFGFINKLKDVHNYKPYTINDFVEETTELDSSQGVKKFETQDKPEEQTKNMEKTKKAEKKAEKKAQKKAEKKALIEEVKKFKKLRKAIKYDRTITAEDKKNQFEEMIQHMMELKGRLKAKKMAWQKYKLKKIIKESQKNIKKILIEEDQK